MRRSADPVLLTLLIATLATNVYLVRRTPPTAEPVPQLKVGAKVPEFTASRLGGGELAVRYTSKPVILYVFNPACHWCERNLDNVNAVAMATRAEYQFIGVSLTESDLEQYVRDKHIAWEVASRVPGPAFEAFRMGATPETIVVGTGGTVLHVWQGAFGGTIAADIQHVFGVRLPGLKPEPSTVGG